MSEFKPPYWRRVPHVFVPARWGHAYCDLCNDPRRRVIHLRREDLGFDDPRSNLMPRGYMVGRPSDGTWYRIDGWSDDGGSCSYPVGPHTGFEGAVEMARIMKLSGDGQGRVYDHYAVIEIYEHTVCDTNVHHVEELM